MVGMLKDESLRVYGRPDDGIDRRRRPGRLANAGALPCLLLAVAPADAGHAQEAWTAAKRAGQINLDLSIGSVHDRFVRLHETLLGPLLD